MRWPTPNQARISLIISQAMAERLFPGEQAVGKAVYMGPVLVRVIGVVETLKRASAMQGDLEMSQIMPMVMNYNDGGFYLLNVADPAMREEELYHLARRSFQLNGSPDQLILLRLLTHELRRQEVLTWKKVIRVISHELNNSLAPIASLAHSGAELLRRGRTEQLPQVLAVIEERARHLEQFIHGYARFAKLPAPQQQTIHWADYLAGLQQQISFSHEPPAAGLSSRGDAAQLSQALLNLLKNAHEAVVGKPAEVQLRISAQAGWIRIEILDNGSGMSEAVLHNALLPFYSTKRNGTGLGLALVREIIEAHGGRIALNNRAEGGLCVSVLLPA